VAAVSDARSRGGCSESCFAAAVGVWVLLSAVVLARMAGLYWRVGDFLFDGRQAGILMVGVGPRVRKASRARAPDTPMSVEHKDKPHVGVPCVRLRIVDERGKIDAFLQGVCPTTHRP